MRASTIATLAMSLGIATIPRVLAACGPPQSPQPQWKCDVCSGNYGTGSAPQACAAFNATYDDIAAGPLAAHNSQTGPDRYDYTNWYNFDVINTTAAAVPSGSHINPFSRPNYARVSAGKTGLLDYATVRQTSYGDVIAGAVYGLHYACTSPSQATPTGCHVNVTQYCQSFTTFNFTYSTTILDYSVTSASNTSMASAAAFDKVVYPHGPGYNGACYNTTMTAVSTKGHPVDLYVDDVLFLALIRQ